MQKRPIPCPLLPSPSFFNNFLLIFQISIVQWLNCRNLKDGLNRSYNGGGVVYLLKSEASRSTWQYARNSQLANSLFARLNKMKLKLRVQKKVRTLESDKTLQRNVFEDIWRWHLGCPNHECLSSIWRHVFKTCLLSSFSTR